MKKKLKEYDSDFQKVMENFPIDEDNAYLFIRGHMNINDNYDGGFVKLVSDEEMLVRMILGLLNQGDGIKNCVFSSVLTYMESNRDEIGYLIGSLNDVFNRTRKKHNHLN